jgi:hypothetical protein
MASIKDSGQRRSFSTGSVRDIPDGKGRFDLLPTRAIRALAVHFENGAKKYGIRNWEKGMPLSQFLDSGLRHGFQVLEGAVDEPHTEAAIWNFMCFLETRERIRLGLLPKELDDIGACEPKESV